MENGNVKKDNIVPVYTNYYGDYFDKDDKEFMSQYNNILENYFAGLYKKKYDKELAVAYEVISDERIIGLSSDFDYKSTFAEILF